jgi:hypothetical protein
VSQKIPPTYVLPLGGIGVRAWGVILTPAVFAKEAMSALKRLTLPFVFREGRAFYSQEIPYNLFKKGGEKLCGF